MLMCKWPRKVNFVNSRSRVRLCNGKRAAIRVQKSRMCPKSRGLPTPALGIIGTNTGNCTWNSDWLAFECKEYDYEMMIIESMDSDTELRRLSPVAIVGDETIDLINGPMDHGWCHHYTCQKRVSTFYSIVAMNKHYEIHLTSTSPKVIRYRFLDIDDDQAVTLALYYSTPLRLDVYRNGAIIYPNNADIVDGKYILKPKDPNLPDDQYRPQLNGTVSGSNFMEKWEQTLYVLVKGPDAIEIRISDVVIVSFDIDPVLVSEFYGDDIVRNLVLLLGISEDQIRIVNVVRETSRRKKRETVNQLAVEIGDPPEGSSGSATLANDTIPGSLSVDDLSAISSNLTEMAQDGSLSASINVTVFGVGVVEPVVTPVYLEPDNTTRNDTEPIANITQSATIFLIPHHIETDTNPEYQSFVTHTLMVELKDFRDDLVENLARDWWADMQLIDSEGNPVNVSGNVTARFENGYAIFEDVIFVEYGRDYSLQYTVQGVSWAPLQSTQFDVARPQFPATDEVSARVCSEFNGTTDTVLQRTLRKLCGTKGGGGGGSSSVDSSSEETMSLKVDSESDGNMSLAPEGNNGNGKGKGRKGRSVDGASADVYVELLRRESGEEEYYE